MAIPHKSQWLFSKIVGSFFIYNLLVIMWGAWVRISFSGDGCGNSWPLCDGAVLPTAAHREIWIEWFHRASTGIFGLVSLFIFFWSRRIFAESQLIKRLAGAVLLFTVSEALVGAALVKLGLVSQNASVFRAWVMGFHQINSLALTGAIYLLWRLSSGHQVMHIKPKVAWILSAFSLVAFTGALAALAGTLFPSLGLIAGLLSDLDTTSPVLVRLRLSHPTLAMIFGLVLLIWALRVRFNRWRHLALMISGAVLFGILTLVSLSPTWMKLGHLGITHVLFAGILDIFVLSRPEGRD